MNEDITTNKQGQLLGRKGHETRQRLMDAARNLLKSNSPVELTAVAIAKKAKLSSPTFYIYFTDIRDLLIAQSEAAEADMSAVHEALDEPWNASDPDMEHAARVVALFAAVWDKHRDVLRFRNLEADRGDVLLEKLRLRNSVRIVKRFAEHIYAGYDPRLNLTKRDAMAEASVLVAAMERLAAADPATVERGLGAKAMWKGMTRVIARTLNAPLKPRARGEAPR
jgi:AcrR family transcriptional regulator